jgi:hypothetical protein
MNQDGNDGHHEQSLSFVYNCKTLQHISTKGSLQGKDLPWTAVNKSFRKPMKGGPADSPIHCKCSYLWAYENCLLHHY